MNSTDFELFVTLFNADLKYWKYVYQSLTFKQNQSR